MCRACGSSAKALPSSAALPAPDVLPPPEGEGAERRNLKLLVAVLQRLDAFAEIGHPGHRRAQRGARAVRADEDMHVVAQVVVVSPVLAVAIMGNDDFCRCLRSRSPAVGRVRSGVEPGRGQPAIEVDLRARAFGSIQQQDVQAAARHRMIDFLLVDAVALQGRGPVHRVHHPPAHHHRLRQHRVGEPRHPQRLQPALGQRQVDRSPAGEPVPARVRPAFEHLDLESALREQRRQQRADQAGADDRDGRGFRGRCHHTHRIRSSENGPSPSSLPSARRSIRNSVSPRRRPAMNTRP